VSRPSAQILTRYISPLRQRMVPGGCGGSPGNLSPRRRSRLGSAIVLAAGQTKLPATLMDPAARWRLLHSLDQANAVLDEMLKKVADKLDQQKNGRDPARAAENPRRSVQAEQDDDRDRRLAAKCGGSFKREQAMQLAGLPGDQGKLADRKKAAGDDLSVSAAWYTCGRQRCRQHHDAGEGRSRQARYRRSAAGGTGADHRAA